MAFGKAIEALSQILEHHVWVGELAGILPLSALLDFIEVPPKLHTLELVGSVPLWSWVITPSGSRLLLANAPASASRNCFQDRFGNTAALEVLDGHYGDRYFAASPETLRLVLASSPRTEIGNDHENVSTADLAGRVRQALIDSEGLAPANQQAYVLSVIRDPRYAAAHSIQKQLLRAMGVPVATGPPETRPQEATSVTEMAGLPQALDAESLKRVLDSNPASANPRTQALEVVYVSRRVPGPVPTAPAYPVWRTTLCNAWHTVGLQYLATVTLGWTLLVCMLIMSILLEMWISFAFCLLVPVTGLVIHAIYGTQPRRLLVDKPSPYNRLLLVTEHMNSAEWVVIYGESTIVNSLLNRPLHPSGPPPSSAMITTYRLLLRVCILGQWALVLGAAATKNWNAYLICFWVSFSIVSHSFLATPEGQAETWARRQANLKIERFGTRVSSRRALLNTIIALNPDSFPHDATGKIDLSQQLSTQGIKWLDPILKPSDSRTRWEKATQEAMMDSHKELETPTLDLKQFKYRSVEDNFLGQKWHDSYSGKGDYWSIFIPEGIYVAAKIKKAGNLSGVFVPTTNPDC